MIITTSAKRTSVASVIVSMYREVSFAHHFLNKGKSSMQISEASQNFCACVVREDEIMDCFQKILCTKITLATNSFFFFDG